MSIVLTKKMGDKENYKLGLKIIGWALIFYLFINLTFYILGRVNHLMFWGSLIIIAVINAYLFPKLRARIEVMN